MIYGVTHDVEGEPIKRHTIAYKLGCGLPPSEGKNYPQRLEYMIVSVRNGRHGQFAKDDVLTKELEANYGAPLMECDIVLLSDDIEEVFRSEYAWRRPDRSNSLLCHGDGQHASRRVSAFTAEEQKSLGGSLRPEDWKEIDTCGRGCPQLDQKLCKPSGDLYFIFPERPVAGSVATLHTGGWESVRRISSSLAMIREQIEPYGGSLKGLRLKLVARPYRTNYTDKGVQKQSTQLAFNLEFRQADYRKLLPTLVKQSQEAAFDMGEAISVEPLPDDVIAEEFHPTEDQVAEQRKAETTVVEPAKSSTLDKLVNKEKDKAFNEKFDRIRDEMSQPLVDRVEQALQGRVMPVAIGPDVL